MKQKTIVILVIVTVIVGVVFGLGRDTQKASALDGFAQCLASKGWTMYGAYWCPHCQNEKAAFGDSFRYVNYVECTQEPNRCTAVGIKGFPTWMTDDGRRFEGEQGIKKLSEVSECSLRQSD